MEQLFINGMAIIDHFTRPEKMGRHKPTRLILEHKLRMNPLYCRTYSAIPIIGNDIFDVEYRRQK